MAKHFEVLFGVDVISLEGAIRPHHSTVLSTRLAVPVASQSLHHAHAHDYEGDVPVWVLMGIISGDLELVDSCGGIGGVGERGG